MLKSHANGCNIVCKKLPTFLDVTYACCIQLHTLLHMLLGIAVQSLKPVKLLAMCKGKQQLLGVIGQQCCAHFARALKL